MSLYKDIKNLPVFKHPVITIGTFDGVHLGHKIVLKQLIEEARKTGGEAIVITFDPHPRHILPSTSEVNLLTTPTEKYAMLEKCGVDHIVAVAFDKGFASQSAETYIKEFLVKNFNPRTIITGYDHRFGNNREGDYHLLEKEGAKLGFAVREIPCHVVEEITISSTRIREALKGGNIKLANHLLGYDYRLEGLVIEGKKLGRQIGFATANIILDKEKLIPANGVYAVRVGLEGKLFNGMMNIGNRPTVGGTTRNIEVHIIDFQENIYGRKLQVALVDKLREEIKFNSIEELRLQLIADREKTMFVLKGSGNDHFSDHFFQ